MPVVSDEDYSDGGGALISQTSPVQPGSSATWNVTRQFNGFRYLMDNHGRMIVFPTFLTTPAGSVASILSGIANDGLTLNGPALETFGVSYVWTGSGAQTFERLRAPGKINVTAAAAASPITVFPAGGAGTIYRLFECQVVLTVAGNLTLSDGTFNWLNAFPIAANTLTTIDYGSNGIPGTGAGAAITATFTGGGNGSFVVTAIGPIANA